MTEQRRLGLILISRGSVRVGQSEARGYSRPRSAEHGGHGNEKRTMIGGEDGGRERPCDPDTQRCGGEEARRGEGEGREERWTIESPVHRTCRGGGGRGDGWHITPFRERALLSKVT
ncbi:hypothetical protein SKAU_G00402180 [Synaphobranchus kaupii]|uniref:Uncharacterized protein n=1 Tax=Synaphobranchus kaupii TaxID=118154 RepID=A0A9Q1E977_SYNKA|nr:hypothetical protein SKAU_G00402180 [Synaphobranchus kaupii]